MSQQQAPYTTSADLPVKIEYINDAPDVREWLMNLRRDLLRKVKQIDELLLTLPLDKR